jgi:hypothetical protein
MKINQITVSAGRTFNHPYEQYSNLKPSVCLVATLDESDNPESCAKDLQARAEKLVEDHKSILLQQVKELYDLSQQQSEMVDLAQQLRRAQSRIDEIRKKNPVLATLQLPELGESTRPDVVF